MISVTTKVILTIEDLTIGRKELILATEEVITATLKFISATTKAIDSPMFLLESNLKYVLNIGIGGV